MLEPFLRTTLQLFLQAFPVRVRHDCSTYVGLPKVQCLIDEVMNITNWRKLHKGCETCWVVTRQYCKTNKKEVHFMMVVILPWFKDFIKHLHIIPIYPYISAKVHHTYIVLGYTEACQRRYSPRGRSWYHLQRWHPTERGGPALETLCQTTGEPTGWKI